LIISCCFLQAGAVEKIKTNIQNSSFEMSKSMSYQGQKLHKKPFSRTFGGSQGHRRF
jgi:hypothetical protein